MDPKIYGNNENSGFISNGYYNLQPPTAQNSNNNTIPNYSIDPMMYNNNFTSQQANTNMFTNKPNSQYYPISYAPQNIGHVGHVGHVSQQISPHHIGNTSGNTFGNVSLPIISQREFEIPGFKIKIIVEPIIHQQDQQHLTVNNSFNISNI
jgi:hypothetical protein